MYNNSILFSMHNEKNTKSIVDLTRFKPFVTSYYKKSLINIVYSRPKRIRLRHSKKKMWKEILSKKHLKCNHPYRGHAWNTRCVQHCAAPSHSYAYRWKLSEHKLWIAYCFPFLIDYRTQYTDREHTHTHTLFNQNGNSDNHT